MPIARVVSLALLAAVTLAGCQSSAAARMGEAEVVVVVKFRSRFDKDEVMRRYPARMPQFRALDGLIQKYYLHDDKTGEWCGIYFWDGIDSAKAYMMSDLKKSIPEAYGVEGVPRVEAMKLIDVLRR